METPTVPDTPTACCEHMDFPDYFTNYIKDNFCFATTPHGFFYLLKAYRLIRSKTRTKKMLPVGRNVHKYNTKMIPSLSFSNSKMTKFITPTVVDKILHNGMK